MAFTVSKINTSDTYTTLSKIVKLTLADASNFTVGGDITGDSGGGNDGVGTIQKKSGNEVWVIVTSGTFVAGNDVDNVNPYAGIETSITSVDTTYWELLYNIANRNVNQIAVYYNYTQDTATEIVVKAQFMDTHMDTVNFYDETTIDGLGNITSNTSKITSSMLGRLIFDNRKGEEYIQIVFTPDIISGSDTLLLGVVFDANGS